ncbi:hypothetical protein [Gordonia soli]|nr:hypothetical protein [Gordonia soli]
MSTSLSKSTRKCPTCGANLYVRKDVAVAAADGPGRVDIMLVCRDESCAQPVRHLRTDHPLPA